MQSKLALKFLAYFEDLVRNNIVMNDTCRHNLVLELRLARKWYTFHGETEEG
jgi:hypothetical protein